MASPNSRASLIEYCLRKLGKPVLEINVDDDQIGDLVDDALQYFNERHYDGAVRTYLKHQLTEDNKAAILSSSVEQKTNTANVGIATTSATTDFEEGNITKVGKLRLEKWRSAVDAPTCFPLSLEEQHMDAVEDDVDNERAMWAEDKIDRARAEGEERLMQYKRDVERRRRLNEA